MGPTFDMTLDCVGSAGLWVVLNRQLGGAVDLGVDL